MGSSTQPNSAQGIIQESFTTTGESQYTHHLSVLSTQRHRQVSYHIAVGNIYTVKITVTSVLSRRFYDVTNIINPLDANDE